MGLRLSFISWPQTIFVGENPDSIKYLERRFQNDHHKTRLAVAVYLEIRNYRESLIYAIELPSCERYTPWCEGLVRSVALLIISSGG